MIYCTSICANYIPKASLLARSIKAFDPEAIFVACLSERTIPDFAIQNAYFDDIVLAKDLGINDFDSFMFMHSVVETATSVKGHLFKYLFDAFPKQRKFVYLDPDIEVFGRLVELEEALETRSIVVVPHMTEPESLLDSILDNEINSMQYGVFNLGFLAVQSDKEGRRFIDWWAERLRVLCFDNVSRGVFTDQRWIDLAPGFFDVHILRHEGYDVAPWNLSRRSVTRKDGWYLVNGVPLRFYHFSSFDSKAHVDVMNKYVKDRKNVLYEMWDRYSEALQELGQDEYGAFPWSYARFMSGEKISDAARLRYAIDPVMRRKIRNPYASSNRNMHRLFHRHDADRLGLLLLNKLGETRLERILVALEKSKRYRQMMKWYWKIHFILLTPGRFAWKYFPRSAYLCSSFWASIRDEGPIVALMRLTNFINHGRGTIADAKKNERAEHDT